MTASDGDMHVVDKQGVLSLGVKVTEELQRGIRRRDGALPRMMVRQEKKAIMHKQRNSSRVGMLSG